jgi:serine/threonine protein kinase
LKPENLLVDRDGRVKVADFGFSIFRAEDNKRRKTSDLGKTIGSPLYMSPQLLQGEGEVDYFAGDVWAFGLVVWRTFSSMPLFSEFTDLDVFKDAIYAGVLPPLSREARDDDDNSTRRSPPFLAEWAAEIPTEMCHLITRCTREREDSRPSMRTILHELNTYMTSFISLDPARGWWVQNWTSTANFPGESEAAPADALTFEEVFWDDFSKQLRQTTVSTFDDIDGLREWLSSSNEFATTNRVSLRDFNTACLTFGAFYSNKNALQAALETLRSRWWFGKIDRVVAEQLLGPQDAGSFLIRSRPVETASDDNFPLCLSVRLPDAADKRFVHRLIGCDPRRPDGCFWTRVGDDEAKRFRTVAELLENGLLRAELGLVDPCPRHDSKSFDPTQWQYT